MTVSVSQQILIYVLRGVLAAIWAVDRYFILSKASLVKAFDYSKVYVLLAVDIFLVSFVAISLRSVSMMGVYTGLVPDYPRYAGVSTNDVLGAATKIELPVLVNQLPAPSPSAKSVIVWDVGNEKVLYDKNADEQYAPASTTKLMTALVALDLYALDEQLEVSGECTLVDSTRADLPGGAAFTAEDLLYSLLVASAGDAACVLSSGKVPYDDFVSLMNTKAGAFGMGNTYFTNPVGLDGVNGTHHSTASDLLKLSLRAIRNPLIEKIVGTPNYPLESTNSDYSTTLVNTNHLLWQVPNSVGIKTGTTEAAGEVLIYQYRDVGKDIIVILMGSDDRFGETKQLLDWLFGSYSWDADVR